MIKKMVAVSVVWCVAVLLLAGCSGTTGAEARGKTGWDAAGAPTLDTKVIFNNPSLYTEVAVTDLTSSRSGDMMMAQATLKSKRADTINLQYKFEWYDLGGLALNSSSANWKPILIYGKETKVIQGVAPDPRGREYKLLLRHAE